MDSRIWLSSPHMGGTELNYIHEAFDQNWIAPLGPNITAFEHDLENYLGEESIVSALSSGTAALHLALIILNVERGDEVFCQTMTFSASANPISYVGAKPVFIDSEKETWNMCPDALRAALADRATHGKLPKAVIIVHLYGMPAKMEDLVRVCAEFEVPLLEDAAEALGSTYRGQKCGTFGTLAILSFNGNKIITTSGGGALISKSAQYKKRAIHLSTQARDSAPHYQHSEIGYNYRLSNITAGIGRGQMEVLDERVKARRANHQFYLDLFENMAGIDVFTEPAPDYFSNHWLSAITIDEEITGFNKEDVRRHFIHDNIECRPLWKPMHLQPVFESADYFGNSVAEKLFDKGLCLPSGSNLTEIERHRIQKAFDQMFVKPTCNTLAYKK